VRPPGMGHLEDPTLTSDLTVARDFDLGMTGPPLSISMDFIATGMVEMVGGVASAVILAKYAWWSAIVLSGAWVATHWRESASHGPRLHDFRHRFAVQTLVEWYRGGKDVERRLPVLSTYLGHVHVADTYWYLTACPELMGLAVERLEKRWGVKK
jgi:integrase